MAERALRPFDATAGRVRVSGPTVWLPPEPALSMALIFHELATNAVKYGALSTATGQVDLSWVLDPPGKEWTLTWAEAGGPPVTQPIRRGFGSRLIERGLRGELQGAATVSYDPAGLIWIMQAQLPPRGEPLVLFDEP